MTEKILYQCDFCSKAYSTKYATRRHEMECFYNPNTHSCATCLYSSLALFHNYPRECFIGELNDQQNETRKMLKTKCPKWINVDIAEDVDIFENRNGVIDKLVNGRSDFLPTLRKIANESGLNLDI